MRGSQRARDILKAMGEEAFYWFPVSRAWGPRAHMRVQRPLGGRHIAQLKKEYLLEGRPWPFEHVSSTALRPLNHPAKWPKGHKHEVKQLERQQTIAKNMEKMPQLIAESRAKRQLPKDIPLYDKLLMSRKQLHQKYVKNRQRHGS